MSAYERMHVTYTVYMCVCVGGQEGGGANRRNRWVLSLKRDLHVPGDRFGVISVLV